MRPPEYCSKVLLLVAGAFFVCCLWKTGSIGQWSSNMSAKALIRLDLLIPSSSSSSSSPSTSRRSPFNRTNMRISRDVAHRRKNKSTLFMYMLQLYYRRPNAVVRAIKPVRTSGPISDAGRILEFAIPSVGVDETLETAELLGIAGAIIRVRFVDGPSTTKNIRNEEIRRARKDGAWRAFDVTSAVAGRNDTVQLWVYGTLTYRPNDDGPILLLNYSKVRRYRRSAKEPDDPDRWEDGRRRRRNNCHRRFMYVNFSVISYDKWVLAPDGYEAYQCSGRCSFPMGDHLSPTNHAIVQALMHGALQISESGNKLGKPCCVPTKLESMSLLYVNDKRTVTYEYDYEDMVVVECGCR
ncbi:uncharacterized protein [Temnothorax longispinosus]|uniref:TGF-beta family profile domain-containing protein n=1 Tax=Temnothorax longispinosus TaxID=300112 RepID=A0A4S2KPU6_9HYME|nr:Uncharacterized protein DBV15_11233 [Temnothorax longispinosus]